MRRVLSGGPLEEGASAASGEVLAQSGARAGGGQGNTRMAPQIGLECATQQRSSIR
jgi:hypothetical protein